MRLRFLVSMTVLLAGCATPGLQGVIPYNTEVTEANNAIQNSYLPPPRGTEQSEWQATLDRVTEKISPALQKTCLSVGAANCWASDTNRISIIHEPTINAFVDGDHRIGVHSGLIQNASSDEEIAAVIAHEYGHIFAGHIGKQGSNAGLGVLAGIAVGAILTNETGVNQSRIGYRWAIPWEQWPTASSSNWKLITTRP